MITICFTHIMGKLMSNSNLNANIGFLALILLLMFTTLIDIGLAAATIAIYVNTLPAV